MARSARRKTAPGAAVTTTVAAPWQRNRKVVNLTKAIRALDKKTAKMFVDAVVKIGRMLADAREELPHGEWLAWLDNGVFYAHRTASRYIAVAQWAHTRAPASSPASPTFRSPRSTAWSTSTPSCAAASSAAAISSRARTAASPSPT
jgi:hypothetical protein